MLFLGAGASKAVDIGDLADITKKVIEALNKAGYSDLINHIIEILTKANTHLKIYQDTEIDLETILTVLNATANPNDTLKELGPYPIYMSALQEEIRLRDEKYIGTGIDRNKINGIVAEAIIEVCKNFSLDKAVEYYEKLFTFGRNQANFRGADGKMISAQIILEPIVTTNYDLVLERYRKKTGQIIFDEGFRHEDKTGDYILDTEEIFQGKAKVDYLKLHGSISWFIRDSDKAVVRRDSPTSLFGDTYSSNLMIYPVFEKYVSLNPYFALYSQFRRFLFLSSLYIVVGYSFRDPSINNAFSDALRSNRTSRMIIVNSNPERIRQRIRDLFPKERLDLINMRFGEAGLTDELAKRLHDAPKGDI